MNDTGRTTEQQRADWAREPDGKVDRSTVSRVFGSRITLLVSAAIICAIALIAGAEWLASFWRGA
jgi:hypothetical protein